MNDVEAMSSAVSWMETCWTVGLVGLAVYVFLKFGRSKIDKTGPTDDVIEDLEDRGKIW